MPWTWDALQLSLALNLDIDGQISRHVFGDPTRIRQILLNLIGNALKFTEKGEINIKAYQDKEETHFIVSDTGIGMTDEQLVEKMGVKIWSESELGKGSEFHFTINFDENAPPASAIDQVNVDRSSLNFSIHMK